MSQFLNSFPAATPVASAAVTPIASPLTEQEKNETARARIVWDGAMDLLLLRQIRGTGNPFVRGSSTMDDVVATLASADARFTCLKKKGAADRLNLLLAKHAGREARSKAASGVEQDYSETDHLLTELTDQKREREIVVTEGQAAAREERRVAEQLRDDACRKLGDKATKTPTKHAAEKVSVAAAPTPVEAVVTYLTTSKAESLELEKRKVTIQERDMALREEREMEEAAARRRREEEDRRQGEVERAQRLELQQREMALKEREMTLREERAKEEASAKRKKDEEDKQTAEDTRAVRRMFIEVMASMVKKAQQ